MERKVARCRPAQALSTQGGFGVLSILAAERVLGGIRYRKDTDVSGPWGRQGTNGIHIFDSRQAFGGHALGERPMRVLDYTRHCSAICA